MIRYTIYECALGPLLLHASEIGAQGIHFVDEKYYPGIGTDWREDPGDAILQSTRQQLTEYFTGQRTRFDLPLDPHGSPFQQRVWQALREIPFGETRSYSEIARHLGDIKSVRAVGAANGRNPLSIVVPCHRVIGADGSLTGYAGGLARKQALLRLESRQRSFDSC